MQVSAQLGELFEVASAELTEAAAAQWCQAQPHDPVVLAVGSAPYEAGCFGPVDQADRAVVPDQEHFGDLTDSRRSPIPVTSDRQQELMLHRGEARRDGLFLAPVQEAPQADPELE